MRPGVHAVFSVAASLVVAAAVTWGALLVGSPSTARLLRLDEERLKDLQKISREVQLLCQHPDKAELKNPLPRTLDELSAQPRSEKINLADPQTGARYVYTVTGETTYELCATFALNRDSDVGAFWNHPSGRHCFSIDAIDPP